MIVPEGRLHVHQKACHRRAYGSGAQPGGTEKGGRVANRAVGQARPNLMKASRRAGELTRKAHDKLRDMTDPK